ncbi:MAG: MEDS domain-containing protein [Ilumatobacteraceae bacterium]
MPAATIVEPFREESTQPGFRHEAVLYNGQGEFVEFASRFVRDAVAAGYPTFVVVSATKIEALHSELQDEADDVLFADMAQVGRNPGLLLTAWEAFIEEHRGDGLPLRGIGELVWPGRNAAQLAECHIQEALANIAFGTAVDMWVLCPYDISAMSADVIEGAFRTHRYLVDNGIATISRHYDSATELSDLVNTEFPPAPSTAASLSFATTDDFGRLLDRYLGVAGFADRQRAAFIEAAIGVAALAIDHSAGTHSALIWVASDDAVLEIGDIGEIDDPFAGRRHPHAGDRPGHALWIANQVCELVQIRNTCRGTAARMHIRHDVTDPLVQGLGDSSELGTHWIEVHQAIGMVAVQLNTTGQRALVAMRGLAYTTGVGLDDLAAAVIDRRLRFPADR